MSRRENDGEGSGRQDDSGRTSRPELVVGALGGLLVLAAFAFLVYQAVAVREGGPELHTAVTGVESEAGQYVVRLEVANDGGVTAESVRVVGELRRAGTTVEQVSSTIPYVPVESSRAGALVFTEDPGVGTLQLRAATYNWP